MNTETMDELLAGVKKPVRYTGNEYNMVEKKVEDMDVRFAFAFPDLYEIGMSHLGMRILYHMLNERKDTYCERVFAPWTDMEKNMRAMNIPLFTLETKDYVKDFDIVGFTLQYEMSYTNIVNMLDLALIPVYSKHRDETHPIVIAGGPCAYNPEPLSHIIDIFVIGEAEEVIHELLDAYKDWKNKGRNNRTEFLQSCGHIQSVYIPSNYEVQYQEDASIKRVFPVSEEYEFPIRKRIVRDLEQAYYPVEIIVPYTDIVHDRVVLEVFRGCSKGCRFCQAGMIYRPVRERSLDRLLKLADSLLKSSGYEEISLASLSITDYLQLEELVMELMRKYEGDKISVSLPSMRLDSFSKEFVEQVKKVRKTGLTFAPEAGTQRLRDVINKGVTEEDLLKSVKAAFELGWNTVKLYFMLGLPEETDEDIQAIALLAHKVMECYRQTVKKGRKLKLTISTSTFVPKPFTPFQWHPQNSVHDIIRKQEILKKMLNKKGIIYNWHEPELSFLEAIFSRGDRRLNEVLVEAWKKGCMFDSWNECFRFDKWMEAFEESGIEPGFYANRLRETKEVLPWDHIDTGISKSFLEREQNRALKGENTPDCRVKCSNCGITDLQGGIC